MTSYRNTHKLISFFGRLTYNYNEKYMFMASLRREGSSRFGDNHKWGWFPAISAGWRISKENFMQDIQWLDDLKVRIGYGVTGNEVTSNLLSMYLLNYGGYAYINGKWTQGAGPYQNPNPDLKWETKSELNLGLDFSFLKNRLSGSIDIYHRETSDLLSTYEVPTPPYIVSSMMANVGKIRNQGIELLLSGTPIKTRDLRFDITGTFSYNKNKIISLSNGLYQKDYWYEGATGSPIQTHTHIVREGDPVGNFHGFQTHSLTSDGLWMVYGADGQPKLLTDADDGDKKVIGNGIPTTYGSLNLALSYKGFDVSVMFRGAFNFQVLNRQRMHWETTSRIGEGNLPRSVLEKPFGSNSYVKGAPAMQSYYVEDGDYVKLDNISVGYTFNLKKQKVIQRLRLYVAGNNLLTMTGYKGLDPEVSIKGLAPGVEGYWCRRVISHYTSVHCWLKSFILTLKNYSNVQKTIYYWCIFSCYLFIQFLYQFWMKKFLVASLKKTFIKLNLNSWRAMLPIYSSMRTLTEHSNWWDLEETTDVCVTPVKNHGLWYDGGIYIRLHQHSWMEEDAHLNNIWNALYSGVSSANRVLYQFENSTIEMNGKENYIAELKVARAFYYYLLLEAFGNVPIIDRFDVPDGYLPATEPRSKVFEFVESELKNNINNLSEDVLNTYGRFNKWNAKMLLARLYLNAEAWIGTPMYNECENLCNEIIATNKYRLDGDYSLPFSTNNELSNETMFVIPFDETKSGGQIYMWARKTLHYSQMQTFNLQATWLDGGCVGVPTFFDNYIEGDKRLEKTWRMGQQYALDGTPLWTNGWCGDPQMLLSYTKDVTNISGDATMYQGYRFGKYEIKIGATGTPDNDYVIMRYAEVLMYES